MVSWQCAPIATCSQHACRMASRRYAGERSGLPTFLKNERWVAPFALSVGFRWPFPGGGVRATDSSFGQPCKSIGMNSVLLAVEFRDDSRKMSPLSSCRGCWRPRFRPAPPHASWLDQAEFLNNAFGYHDLRRGWRTNRKEFIAHIAALIEPKRARHDSGPVGDSKSGEAR